MEGLFRQAVGLHQAGRFSEAEQVYKRILSIDRNNFETLQLLGTMEAQRGNLSNAHHLLSNALKLRPRSFEVLINLGNIAKLQGRLEEALKLYGKALAIDPSSILALNNHGSTLSALRRFNEARASFDKALKIKHDYGDALYNRGNLFIKMNLPVEALADLDKAQATQPNPQVLVSRGMALMMISRIDEAIKNFDRALTIHPGFVEALLNRGVALTKQKRLTEALASYDQALLVQPNYAEALSNRGLVLHDLKRFNEAVMSYDRALAAHPNFVEAHSNRGRTLCDLKRFDDALAAYGKALMLKPDFAEAFCGRGNVLFEMTKYSDALADFDQALTLKPELAEAWLGRGNVFTKRRQGRDASAAYDRALTLNSDFAEAFCGRGNVFAEIKQYNDALTAFDRSLALKPDLAEAWLGRGDVLHKIIQYSDALAAFDKALALKPELAEAWLGRGNVLLDQSKADEAIICYRRGSAIKAEFRTSTNLIFARNFELAATTAEQQAERIQWDELHARQFAATVRSFANDPDPDRRLRIGYVSSHFCHQAATYAFGGVLLCHDPKLFEVVCYSDTWPEDDVTGRLRPHVGKWQHTASLTDDALADLIRTDGIDILVDLVGHMSGHRLLVFARRPAPVQVTAWGEPTGTGLSVMDYLLADPVLVPVCERASLVEQVIDLPNFLGYWVPDQLPEPGALPTLSRGHITFGSFNRLAKILDPVLRTWASILRLLPDAHLVLKDRGLADLSQRARIHAILAEEGVAVERVKLLGPTDRAAHFAAYQEVDLALDPYPHGGGMSTLDALWMGVPVVTWSGRTISSRLAAASLSALGLTDFIAPDLGKYVELAVAKAVNDEGLSSLRANLRKRIADSTFGDCTRYTRAVESAYREIWRRWCVTGEGQPGSH
jgi:predicted O-linked N-acetylglucosamine transferase (SPINDLY family)